MTDMQMPQRDAPTAGGPVSGEIRAWLERALDEGRTELDAAARYLEVSPRTLRRRLQGEGETFQGLLDTVRRERALGLLAQGALPIGEVSRVLGFTRITSFYRAFRRWTGSTPAAYRASHGPVDGEAGAAEFKPTPEVLEPTRAASDPSAPTVTGVTGVPFRHDDDSVTAQA